MRNKAADSLIYSLTSSVVCYSFRIDVTDNKGTMKPIFRKRTDNGIAKTTPIQSIYNLQYPKHKKRNLKIE